MRHVVTVRTCDNTRTLGQCPIGSVFRTANPYDPDNLYMVIGPSKASGGTSYIHLNTGSQYTAPDIKQVCPLPPNTVIELMLQA